jgi:acyl dehydratase
MCDGVILSPIVRALEDLVVQDTSKRLEVGQYGVLTRAMSRDLVGAFAYVSGDDNPVHLDPEYAAGTQFKKPIAHGMLYGAMISTIFGAQFDGAIYLSQQFHFKKPVYVGDSVTATVTVTNVKTTPYIVTCKTTITDAVTGHVCTDGEAKVLLPEPQERA